MRRQFAFEREPEFEGSQESQNEAMALAVHTQPDLIRAFDSLKTFLDDFGGEAYIAAYREKFDDEGHKVGKDEVGEWQTLGYMIHIESVAKNTDKVTGAEKQPDDRLNRPRPLPDPEDNGTEPAPEAIENADREALEAIESAA